MNIEEAKSHGAYWSPDSASDLLKGFERLSGRIKAKKEFFEVSEQSTLNFRCTPTTHTDLPHGQIFADEGTGRLVRVTMVKKGLTTPAAIERVKALLGGNRRRIRITYAGLKDRWGVTAQWIVIEGADYDEVVRNCMPSMEELDQYGVFIKDAVRTDEHLGRGKLVGNHFRIKVLMDPKPAGSAGQLTSRTKAELDEYMRRTINHLMTRDGIVMIPNFLGGQRLGKRRNLFGVAWDFIHEGPEAGIKRFITETSPFENASATELRTRLGALWAEAEQAAAHNGSSIAHQRKQLLAMKELLEEGGGDRQAYQRLNMTWEKKIICQLVACPDYIRCMSVLEDDFSLWTGAYQGFWFNQILDKVLRGEIELDNQDDPEAEIPLVFDDRRAMYFYHRYMPEAVPARIDPSVRRLFLSPQYKNDRGPRRPLWVAVDELEYDCEDGAVNLRFRLRKGAYATNFLGIIFRLTGWDEKTGGEGGEQIA